MNATGPCCSPDTSKRDRSWEEARTAALTTAGALEAPPQLIYGMSGAFRADTGALIGKVFTFVVPATSTWTEHWVVQPADFFSNSTYEIRLAYPKPQPPMPTVPQIIANHAGWYHAAMTFQYQQPPATVPQLALGTFVFDVFCVAATTTWQGRLFRSVVGATVHDIWVLFPGYIGPNGPSATELKPKAGDAQTLFQDALTAGGSTSEYVDVTYVVTLI